MLSPVPADLICSTDRAVEIQGLSTMGSMADLRAPLLMHRRARIIEKLWVDAISTMTASRHQRVHGDFAEGRQAGVAQGGKAARLSVWPGVERQSEVQSERE
jgi:hypothetical protein